MLRLLSLLLISLGFAALAADRPNLVLFIADDVSAEDLGCYGNPGIRTPVIDRLAADGLRFDNAFLTCSSCSPSRCSLMSGRYPHATGAAELHQPLPAEQPVFPERLRQAGYHTAAAGKWHLGPHAIRGFDVIKEGGKPSGCEYWAEVVQGRPKDRPFFLYLAAFDAHRDYEPNAIAQPHRPADVRVPPYLPDTPETREDLALYYDEISRFDQHIGRVVEMLRADGVLENTLMLVMADNGRAFPRCKTTVLDSGLRTPFVVHWPARVKPGQVGKNLVSSVDIAPTFCAAAGVDPDPAFQGVSFLPQLDNPATRTRKFAFGEHHWHDYQAHERSVTDGRHLYVWNARPDLPRTPPADAVRSITHQAMLRLHDRGALHDYQADLFRAPRQAEELYDREADPHQLSDRFQDPALTDTAARLKAALASWQRETGDAVPAVLTPDKFDRRTGLPLQTAGKKKKAGPKKAAPAKP
jgi:arylsulfatase A-like enzyme